MKDYSEHGEGAFLVNFFKEHPAKYEFLVDIGAFGIELSNTFNLLELGWSGILVEPMPVEDKFAPLVKALEGSSKVRILNLAISDYCGECDGFVNKVPGWNSLVRSTENKVQLTVSTLPKVLEEYNVPLDFDLLSIDTEGMDFRIIKHLLSSNFCPRVIIFEKNKEFDESIFEKNYTVLFETAGNKMYVKKELKYPNTLLIESTSKCDKSALPCVMCTRGDNLDWGEDLPDEVIKKLASFILNAKVISLNGAGEPLLYKNLFKIVDMAKEGTEISFASNGNLLTEEMRKRILDSKITRIDFSLDAATPDTYSRIRRGDFFKVIGSIASLAKERDARELNHPQISINMTLMLENIKEVTQFVILGKALGAVRVTVWHMQVGPNFVRDWFTYENNHCQLQPELHDTCIKEATVMAKKLGVDFVFEGKMFVAGEQPATPHGSSEFFCAEPFNTMLVHPNGMVRNCCFQLGGIIGDLKIQSPEDVWFGQTMEDIRSSTANHVPHPFCKNSTNLCYHFGRI